MKITTVLFTMLLLLPVALAITEIDLRTNEVYIAEFATVNVDADELRNCVPSFQGDLKSANWTSTNPELFSLGPGEQQNLLIVFDNPPVGYYEDEFQIRCERWLLGEFLDVVDIIDPAQQPVYHVLVKEAGEGQSYLFQPGKSYTFLSKPGQHESATFTIINTGTEDLQVLFLIPPEYKDVISIDPQSIRLDEGDVQRFTVTVDVPSDFTSLIANVTVTIGDFDDTFIISGERESLAAGGAAVTSVVFGNIEVGGFDVPTPIIIGVLALGFFLVFQADKKSRRRKK